jgi:hypothetical protein
MAPTPWRKRDGGGMMIGTMNSKRMNGVESGIVKMKRKGTNGFKNGDRTMTRKRTSGFKNGLRTMTCAERGLDIANISAGCISDSLTILEET